MFPARHDRHQPAAAKFRGAWVLQLASNVLLIPGTGSTAHLRENVAAEYVTLDDAAVRELAGVDA